MDQATPTKNTQTIAFTIVESTLPYNIIFGRSEMIKFRAILSTIHDIIRFHKLKMALAELPTLTLPILGEVLIMYLSTFKTANSVVLVENREVEQVLIYFVSRILQRAKMGYTDMEKQELFLINATRRLRIYFLAHTIEVHTNITLCQVLLM